MPNNGFIQWLDLAYMRWMTQAGKHRTQREFAQFLGLRAANINHYLSGRRSPTGKQHPQLAENSARKFTTWLA